MRKGWLKRQMAAAKREVHTWPKWKRDLLRAEIRRKR